MIEIDTLILSGGGNKCLSFLGSLKYLLDHKIIDLKKLKKVIGVSGGMIFFTPLLLGYSIDEIIKISCNTNQKNLLNYDNFSIQNLLNEYGIFENNLIEFYCNIFEKYKNFHELTLQKFYEITKIDFIGKVINLSKNKIEYINYKSHPNLKLSLLIQMTTCIPIIFKPIYYENNYYIDGGLCGNFPNEINKSKNYLGLNILNSGNNDIQNILDYILSLKKIIGRTQNNKKKKRIINLKININILDVDLSIDQKKEIIKEGYLQTQTHFK
tara:strand:- start:208 stop:1014 length:807 start_codon:yes stop_codon:yes gene_type:complete